MKRFFIIRVNGIDWAVVDDPNKARDGVEVLKAMGCKEESTELNNLTTTYNFTYEFAE